MPRNLTPRSAAALAVVAASFFLVVLVARYGAAEFANPGAAGEAGFAASLSAWLVQTLGAGLWALLVLPLAWGAIVYFDEETPDILLRLAGTVVFAVSLSTLVGLGGGGLWAGHVGEGVAGALGVLPDRLGVVGTVLAWCLALALLGVSGLFATDWMFHSLRRAGRTAAAQARVVASEPRAELLEDPAEAQPREFVASQAPAAPLEVAAAAADPVTPEGWDEHQSGGRTVIAAPSGYRGVEFLPPSDELAHPESYARPLPEIQPEPSSSFEQEFVATPDAAFFVERPDLAETQDIFEEIEAEDPVEAEPVPDEVEEAVEALFAAVTEPPAAPSAPASGIGLPPDSPFLDEFFPAEAGWPYASEPAPSDGASAAGEMAEVYAAASEPSAATPADAAAPAVPPSRIEEPAFEDDLVAIDEVIVSRLPAPAFDDVIEPLAEGEPLSPAVAAPSAPAEIRSPSFSVESAQEEGAQVAVAVAVAEPVEVLETFAEPVAEETSQPAAEPEPAAAAPEPAPQLDLFAATEPEVEATPVAIPERTAPDLARLAALELDPLFYEAVDAILDRGRASAVVLQRQLGIGYARGIRILDQMTASGLIGPDTPNGAREIRVAPDAWLAHRGR